MLYRSEIRIQPVPRDNSSKEMMLSSTYGISLVTSCELVTFTGSQPVKKKTTGARLKISF